MGAAATGRKGFPCTNVLVTHCAIFTYLSIRFRMEKEKVKDEILEYICGRHQMGPSTIPIIFGPTGPLADNVLILYQDMSLNNY